MTVAEKMTGCVRFNTILAFCHLQVPLSLWVVVIRNERASEIDTEQVAENFATRRFPRGA
jgi:hypothetical protein